MLELSLPSESPRSKTQWRRNSISNVDVSTWAANSARRTLVTTAGRYCKSRAQSRVILILLACNCRTGGRGGPSIVQSAAAKGDDFVAQPGNQRRRARPRESQMARARQRPAITNACAPLFRPLPQLQLGRRATIASLETSRADQCAVRRQA